MSRDWKPGDVAMALHPVKHKAEVRGFIDTDGRFYTTDQSVAGISSSCFALDNLRPLVVIDPEDREQVERLRGIVDGQFGPGFSNDLELWQAALREFAKPTPPKCGAALTVAGEHFACVEPEGHGASHRNPDAEAVWGESA